MKICSKCREAKPLSEYWKHTTKDGLRSECKVCRRAYKASWDARNSKRVSTVNLAWAQKNRERIRAQQTTNAERRDGSTMRAVARRRGAGVTEFVSPLVVLELHDGCCGICGEDVDPLGFDLDHIVPIRQGGFHTLENLQPVHATCNLRKGARV